MFVEIKHAIWGLWWCNFACFIPGHSITPNCTTLAACKDSTANEGRRSRWGASTRKEPTESAPSDGRVPFLRPESEELNQGHQDSQVESDPWETWRPGEASKEQADEDSHGESDPWERNGGELQKSKPMRIAMGNLIPGKRGGQVKLQ